MLTLKYYYSTKQKYCFFDRLIDSEQGQKDVKLYNMGISYSTYRGNKANNILYLETFNILLKYFGVKNIDENKKDKYELCINKIYYNSLYKYTDSLKYYLEEIQLYIDDNNYLKPIFVLFKVLGYMNYTYTYDELVKILSKDIEYLLIFKKLYFVDDYELIYLSIMHYFKQTLNYSNLYSMVEKPNKYRWIYFQTTATLEYLNFNDYEALIYYDKALKEFEEYNILERKLHVINNISLIYNNLHKYDFSLSYSNKVIEYVFSDCESKWITYILQNYLYSLYMLHKSEEIKIFF